MKKTLLIINLMLVFLLALTIKSNAFTYGVTIAPEKDNVNKGESISVKINLSNVNLSADEQGLLGFESNLEYDSNILELLEVKGSGAWSVSYSESSKKITGFILSKDNVVTSDSEIATINFKVNENTTAEKSEVKLSNIKASNGTENSVSIDTVTGSINIGKKEENIKEPEEIKDPEQNTDKTTNTTNTTNVTNIASTNKTTNTAGTTNTKKDNTAVAGSIPKTGKEIVTGVLITATLLAAVIGYIQYKKYENM